MVKVKITDNIDDRIVEKVTNRVKTTIFRNMSEEKLYTELYGRAIIQHLIHGCHFIN